ncbi:hypothetical protein NQ314_019896 [Rhamnusium bicolor]|uniref:F-box domain-containing protein n=1 Tax=Rhamnusium bicolor TaxID=1586634 RepID=A0AAV8WMP0_9CUCU|nr:hypothetical protein NQ314_019896 [Rhamnusium bicolor]
MDQIPAEILIKILSYLNTYDLLQFCTAYETRKCYLNEKSLIRFVDFSRQFDLQNFSLYKLIKENINYTNIQVLNINYLYWIPSEELRKLICNLENLKELYAIDTQLGINCTDVDSYCKVSISQAI